MQMVTIINVMVQLGIVFVRSIYFVLCGLFPFRIKAGSYEKQVV